MDNVTWIYDIGIKVFGKLSGKVSKELKTKYPNINFTKTNLNSITQFPTVYFHEMQGAERNEDIEGDNINAISSLVQIEIYSDKNQKVCEEVSKEVMKVMKSLRYRLIGSPMFDNETTTYKMILRFSRVWGSEDTI